MAGKQRYPELALVARLIAGSGYFTLTVGVIGSMIGAFIGFNDKDWLTFVQSLAAGVGAVVYGVFVIAASQVIRLLMDIEQNTRPEEISPVEKAIAEVLRGEG